MVRFLFIISLILVAPTAMAQQAQHEACVRDVSRFCRPHMNDGDQVVLACLKQNRTRISKACGKVLTEHGE